MIIQAKDSGMVPAFVLPDFTKSFDTVNHELLLAIIKFFSFNNLTVKLIK